MKVIDASDTFYGGYLSSFHHGCKKDAGSDGFTIEKDGAGSAGTFGAAVLG